MPINPRPFLQDLYVSSLPDAPSHATAHHKPIQTS